MARKAYWVHLYVILGTDTVVAAAYEETSRDPRLAFDHDTYTRLPAVMGGALVGHVGSRMYRGDLPAPGPARTACLIAHRAMVTGHAGDLAQAVQAYPAASRWSRIEIS